MEINLYEEVLLLIAENPELLNDNIDQASKNPEIRLEFILRHPEIPWNYNLIASRDDVDFDFIVRSNKYKCDTECGRQLRSDMFNTFSISDICKITAMCDHPNCVSARLLRKKLLRRPIPINIIEALYEDFSKEDWKNICLFSDPDELIARWPDAVVLAILLNPRIQERHVAWFLQRFNNTRLRVWAEHISPEFIIKHKHRVQWLGLYKNPWLSIRIYKELDLSELEYYRRWNFSILDMMNYPDVDINHIIYPTIEWMLLNDMIDDYHLAHLSISIDVLDLYPGIFPSFVSWASMRHIRTIEDYNKYRDRLIYVF